MMSAPYAICGACVRCAACSMQFFKAKSRFFRCALSDAEFRDIARGTAGQTYRQLTDIWVSAYV